MIQGEIEKLKADIADYEYNDKYNKYKKIQSSLYKSIPPNALTKLLAFYELYPDREEGKKALSPVRIED
jgi:hypothetical protein